MVRRRGNGACQPDKLPWRPQSSQRRRHVARVHLRQLVLAVDSELSMGWVDQWVGLDWVEIFQFLVVWVGLGPLQQKY